MTDKVHMPNLEPETRPRAGSIVWQWIVRVVVVCLGIAIGFVLSVIIALFADLIHITC